MQIAAMEAVSVRLPLKNRILTSYGSRKSVSRTIVILRSDNGLTGYGEVSGRVTPDAIRLFEKIVVGKSPWKTTEITNAIKNWSYYPYQKPEPVMAAIEMACLDLQGKAVGAPLYDILGGRIHEKVPVSAYIFYAHADDNGKGRIHTVDEVIAFTRRFVEEHGFQTLKLKGGYFSPDHDLEVMEALRDTFGPGVRLRIDPQGAWTPATAVRVGRKLDALGVEYIEDPCWGAAAMAQVKRSLTSPLATNMCVTQFDELMPAVSMGAVDVVLSDPWYWGGIHPTMALDRACSALGLDIGMHSGSELGIGWGAMVQTATAMPHLRVAIDCMHAQLGDDVIVGDGLKVSEGMVSAPDSPGLGITIDEEKLKKYAAVSASGQLADRLLDPTLADSARPGWSPQMPAW
jgi:glucarate dehydratase